MRFKAPSEITRDYRSFKRFLVILETTAAYGFHDLAEQIHPLKKRLWKEHALTGRSRPEKLRMLFEELGPTFIKLGQILSTRPDLVTPEYARELAKLTEKVSPFPLEKVREIIRRELGREPEEIFREFSSEPLAAASIGQVHAAVLKDGTAVVVKVRRPGVDALIATDLEIMLYIARKLENFNASLARLRPVRIVEEFAYSLRRELNYQFEAANLLRFTRNMSGSEGLVIPRLYLDYTTMRVLTMERLFGDSATQVLAVEEVRQKYDLPRIAELGVNSLLSQIFEYGFFHADPHPGNIFLLEGNRFAFIDFGMMGRVSEEERQDFVRIIDYMLRGQISLMTDTALRMTISGHFTGSRLELERDVGDLVDENINLPLDKLSVSHILEELMEMFNKYELSLKPNLYMMFKALITIEHLGRTFYPQLRIVEMVKPFVQKLKMRALNPVPYLRRFFDTLGENITSLQNMPEAIRNISGKLERGDLTLRVEHHRLNDIEETLYVTGERMSRSLLISALLIGSALIIVAKIPPFWGEIPVIGTLGFCISGLLSIAVLLDDYRKRKLFLRERLRRKRLEEEERNR